MQPNCVWIENKKEKQGNPSVKGPKEQILSWNKTKND